MSAVVSAPGTGVGSQQILDALPAHIALLDAQGRIEVVNAAWREFASANAFHGDAFGVGQDYLAVCANATGECAEEAASARFGIREVLAGRCAEFALEYPCHSPEQRRWFRMTVTPITPGVPGMPGGCVVMHMDITARRESEEEVRRLQRRSVHILEAAAEGIHGLDTDGRITFLNPEAERLLGWRAGEVVGRPAHALYHHHSADGKPYPPEDCPILHTLRDGVRRHVAQDAFFDREGRIVPVEYTVAAKHDDTGRQVGAVVCFRDISERLDSQAALARSEERFRLVARAVANTIWDWDVATRRTVWSGPLDSLFGYQVAQAGADPDFWSSNLHPEDRARVLASVEAALEGDGDTWEQHYRFRRRDGSYAMIVDRGFVVRDREGRALRMVGGMNDVTELRQLEARLHASQRLEAVGQLTGGIAHDFNNLLTVVMGNAELLEERLPAGSGERELAHMVLAAAQRGSDLTQRLLAFARRQALEVSVVDLGGLLRGLRDLLAHALGETHQLRIDAAPGTWVAVDAAQMESAVLNLCLNARDAMPRPGTVVLEASRVQLVPTDIDPLVRGEPGDYIRLDVRDNGQGIAPAVLPKVVEPFFTTKEVGRGTGLGLSMVYGLIKQSHGYLDIRSSPGAGTCVSIFLPRAAAPTAQAQDGADSNVDGLDRAQAPAHVLLVEDDALVRRYAARQLQALGYRVSEADGAEGALQLLRGDASIALMLTDVMMAGLNGRQLAEAAHQLRPDLPVLYSSGYSEDALASEGRLPPGVLLLGKPYNRAELARRVRQALG